MLEVQPCRDLIDSAVFSVHREHKYRIIQVADGNLIEYLNHGRKGLAQVASRKRSARERSPMDCNMKSSQLRWPKWADAIVSAEAGAVQRRQYEEGEAYPCCRLCEKWCSEEHTVSKLHARRKKMYMESRVITASDTMSAIIESSSSIHSETCNATGASNGIIHSNISHEEADEQKRLQHCTVERGTQVPRRWVREAVSQVPESVPQRRVQQRDDDNDRYNEQSTWQEWSQWQNNGWQWW